VSRRLSAVAAAAAAAVAVLLYGVEIGVPTLWVEARTAPLSYMWVVRWAELLAQLLLLVAVLIAVAHMFREGEAAWRSSMHTR